LIPDGIATVRVTGRFRHPDGTAFAGTVNFDAPQVIDLPGAGTVVAGRASAGLDANGEFQVVLVATDNASMNPTGWVYTVSVLLDTAPSRTFALALPSTTPTVDLAAAMPADPAALNYVPVAGPGIKSGAGAPPAGAGNDGDFWLDTTNTILYGPRAAGVWPSTGKSLIGPAGGIATINGHTGSSVDLTAADVGALTQTAADGRYLQTVNGKSGPNPSLTAADVGALTQTAADARYASTSSALTQASADTRYAQLTATDKTGKGIFVPPTWGEFWRPKRAAAQAGTGLARVALVGSSSTQGLYASNLLTTNWAGRVTTSLQSSFGDGGSGFFATARSSVFLGASASTTAWAALAGNLCAASGSWSVGNPYGPGGNYLFTTTVGDSITFQVRGTTIRVYTISGNGRQPWTYKIDGGAAVPVADAGGVPGPVQVTTITGLSAGTHTIVITHNGTGGSSIAVCGVTGENATGTVVNNYGINGARSDLFADLTAGTGPATWSGGSDYPADLVVYAFGANDALAGNTASSWAFNLRQFLTGVRDSGTAQGNTDVVILLQHIGQYDTNSGVWQEIVSTARGVAESYNAALIDFWTLGRNSWNYWNSLGHWGNSASVGTAGTDTVHMSDAGHQYVATQLLTILTS
jgi:hypothetical protein